MKRIAFFFAIFLVLLMNIDVNAMVNENSFTDAKCVSDTSYKESVKTEYELNEQEEQFELVGDSYNSNNYIFYKTSSDKQTLYAYIPDYNNAVKNAEIKEALYDLGILTDENCSDTYVVSKTIIGSKKKVIDDIGKISTPNTASGISTVTIIAGSILLLSVIIIVLSKSSKNRIKHISIFLLMLLASITFKSVNALDNMIEIVDFAPSDNESNALTVNFNQKGDDSNYIIELFNPRLARIDRFPNSVTEYTYQNLESNTIYRVAARTCINNVCSPWSSVKEAKARDFLTINDEDGIMPNVIKTTDEYNTEELQSEEKETKDDIILTSSNMYTKYNNLTNEELSLFEKIKESNDKKYNVNKIEEGIVEKNNKVLDESISVENNLIKGVTKNSKIQSIKLYELDNGSAYDEGTLTLGIDNYTSIGIKTIPEDVNDEFTWESDNSSCIVNKGIVKGVKEGTCKITVSSSNGIKNSVNINVTNKQPLDTTEDDDYKDPELFASSISPTSIELDYEIAPYETGVEIYNVTTNEKTTTTNQSEATINDLIPDKDYAIKIRSYHLENNNEIYSNYSEPLTVKTSDLDIPYFTKLKKNNNTVELSYQTDEDLTGVEIYNVTTNEKTTTENKSSYIWQNTKNNLTYKFKIRSYYIKDKATYYSGYSNIISTNDVIDSKGQVVKKDKIETNISKAVIKNVNKSYIYQAKIVKPKPVVMLNKKKLVLNKDYTVQYKSNTLPGTAKITIKGKGKYKGKKTKKYKIYVKDSVTNKGRSKSGNGYRKTVTLSGRTYKLYVQYRGTYGNDRYGHDVKSSLSDMGGSIGSNGCGPSSMAIVMSGYGYNLNPGQVGRGLAYEVINNPEKLSSCSSCVSCNSCKEELRKCKRMNNCTARQKRKNCQKTTSCNSCKKCSKSGTSPSRATYMQLYLEERGFSTRYHSEDRKVESYATAKRRLRAALKNGHQVVMWVGTTSYDGDSANRSNYRYFTSSGHHFISILSINKKGDKVFVGNPNTKNVGWNSIDKLVKARGLKFWIEIWKPATK